MFVYVNVRCAVHVKITYNNKARFVFVIITEK